ncbi:MAG: hypothetical protein GY755_00180, partial [Chloroflexi bacterium]|nr:hypothetical protein [Chloroflexota bacterium]
AGSVSFTNEIEPEGSKDQTFTYALTDEYGNLLFEADVPDGGNVGEIVPTGDKNILTITPTVGSKDDWALTVTDGQCTPNADGTVTVSVTQDDTTSCTFTNTRITGSVSFTNEVVGGDGDEFEYVLKDVYDNELYRGTLRNNEEAVVNNVPTDVAFLDIAPAVGSAADWTLSVEGSCK